MIIKVVPNGKCIPIAKPYKTDPKLPQLKSLVKITTIWETRYHLNVMPRNEMSLVHGSDEDYSDIEEF